MGSAHLMVPNVVSRVRQESDQPSFVCGRKKLAATDTMFVEWCDKTWSGRVEACEAGRVIPRAGGVSRPRQGRTIAQRSRLV